MKKIWQSIRNFGWGYVLTAILFAVIGVSLFLANLAAIKRSVVIGVVLIAVGLVLLIVFRLDENKHGFRSVLQVILSVALPILGIFSFIFPESIVPLALNLLGLVLIVDGSFKLNSSIFARKLHVFSWLILILSLSLIAVGFYLTKYTPQEEDVLCRLLGSALLVDAVNNLLMPFSIGFSKMTEAREDRKNAEKIDTPSAQSDGKYAAEGEPTDAASDFDPN